MLKYFCCSNHKPSTVSSFKKNPSYPWQIYSLKELLYATNHFHDGNKLGEGGFGTVYWGRNHKGVEIAVKRLKSMTAKAEMEFATEVEMLGRVRHKNLLGLQGFHAGGDERLIVYEYMPNQSLASHLHGSLAADEHLDWQRRMNVAIGSAEGIAYLHKEVKPHIIHRDVKASNVLLDSNFEAKVADFGFAKLVPDGMSHVTTKVKGTLGYLAPEYAMWGKASDSCDVFSFGILLLEIVSGRKPIEKLPGGKKRDIVQWAKPLVDKDLLDHLADPRLRGRYDVAQLRNAVVVGMRCVEKDAERRPTMAEVVESLRDGVEVRRRKEVVVLKVKDYFDNDNNGDEEEEEDVGSSAEVPECKETSWAMLR